MQRQGETKEQRQEHLPLKRRRLERSLGRRSRWELQAQKSVLLLAELPGGQQHAVCCALCLLFHDGAGKEQLEEEWEGGEHLDDQGGQ